MIEVRSPSAPERVLGNVRLLERSALEERIRRVVEGRSAWASDAAARAEALHGWSVSLEPARDELVELVVTEVGKPIREARVEVERGVRILRYYAQMAFDESGSLFPSATGSRLEVERLPVGTALLLTPWNFPVAIPLWKLAPALAFGNTVLLRPSSSAALTAERLVALAPLPEGVLELIPTPTALVEDILLDDRIGVVSFTGSTAVGRHVISTVAGRGGVVQAEMGGQNASIVLDDADLDVAAATIAEASMGYAGQKCTATSRVIVDRSVAEHFVPLLVDRVRALRVDDPQHPETAVGPLITAGARDGVVSAVQEAVARGGKVLTGAHHLDRPGWFYEPTLVSISDPSDRFAQEETFGPAASILLADSEADAVEMTNRSRYGLSGAVFGQDIHRAASVARQLDVGLARVNASTAGVEFYVPFGGNRGSSYGPREQGRAAREVYTKTRTVLIRG
jgi:aldehyde dehydrogenase (NAD+)